jgi:hypothetical protein
MNDQALSQALQGGDFAAAQTAAADYGREVCDALQTTGDPSRRAAIHREALETLGNHLHLARVLRAHLAAQIQANVGSCLYAQPDAQADHHGWQVEA